MSFALVTVLLIILVVVIWLVNHKHVTAPETLYEKTVGYELDTTAETAINLLTEREKVNQHKPATMSTVGDVYTLGNLWRYNVIPNTPPELAQIAQNQTTDLYATTLSRLTTATLDPDFPVDHMLDHMEDYGQFQQEILDDIRANLRNTRLKTAPKQYYQPRKIVNDPQNVHDSAVNDGLRAIYERIKENNPELNETKLFAGITAGLAAHKFSSEQRRTNAQRIFQKMSQDNTISSINSTEKMVLLNVWQRIQAPENQANRATLVAAFCESLADGMEKNAQNKYKSVCVTGRVARVLGAMTLLDKDPVISMPVKTKDIMRNEILAKTAQLIKLELAQAPKEVAMAYEGTITPDETTNKQLDLLLQNLRDKVEHCIRADYPEVNDHTLTEFIQEAQAGIQ